MKKFLGVFFLLNVWFNFAAMAEENAVVDSEEEDTVELNAFGYPDKSYVTTIINNTKKTEERESFFIDCNDEQLLQQARKVLKDHVYYNGNNIIDRRKNVLVFKNIANFKKLSVKDMTSDLYPSVVGRIVELKINNYLNDGDIQVCESQNPILNLKIYLVMYQQDNKLMVEIVNFSDKIRPSFIFEK